MAADFRLGIQSYCFRKFLPLESLMDCLKQVGLKYVEIWPGHQNFDVEPSQVRRMLDTLAANGIRMDSYGQVKFTSDERNARKIFEFCKMAGVEAITADVDPEAFEATDRLCDEYGIDVAIHNHGRKHRYGKMAELEAAFSKTSERFGLCLDTAWMLDAGEDPLEAVERFRSRLYGVHIKDFAFDDNGEPQDVIVGTGGLDLPKLMRMLNDTDYDGYLSLEYEGNADDPLADVTACVQEVQKAIALL